MRKIIRLEEKDIIDTIASVYNVNENKIKMNITKKSVPGGEDIFLVGAEFDEDDIIPPTPEPGPRPPHPPVPPIHGGGMARV